MTKVFWRGTEYSLSSYYYGAAYGMVNYQHPYSQIYALNDSADNCADAGVIMVGAAGNYYHKTDIPGGIDYDNYYKYGTYGEHVYYHAGTSPTCAPSFVTVGAIDNNTGVASERKVYFSETGPRVDIYAPGTSIMGAYANKPYNTSAVADSRDSSYYLNKISGTSQATPQVAGVIACYLQANPTMNTAEVKSMIRRNSTKGALHEGAAGYTNLNHLQGGHNNVLYNPFVAQTRGRIGPV
jgi:subtilisin family serine protease